MAGPDLGRYFFAGSSFFASADGVDGDEDEDGVLLLEAEPEDELPGVVLGLLEVALEPEPEAVDDGVDEVAGGVALEELVAEGEEDFAADLESSLPQAASATAATAAIRKAFFIEQSFVR